MVKSDCDAHLSVMITGFNDYYDQMFYITLCE